ncbi:uncharacterized protein LOC126717608 isoform X2 [Quercus robur]|uniref:uncharacterized protein LOC126717608 isoform X2 n=1 Tax=Quercus robur TaxID=38942 RepID=UPI002163F9C9|nr:uncharacterized protein LOC126717608 isoform X2 [Quercus robur]
MTMGTNIFNLRPSLHTLGFYQENLMILLLPCLPDCLLLGVRQNASKSSWYYLAFLPFIYKSCQMPKLMCKLVLKPQLVAA